MSRAFPWNRLGIDATSDTAAIRKAYADALRATNLDEDIAGYAELRRARDQALWHAAQSQRGEGDDDFGLGDLDDDWDEGDGWDDSPAAYHPDPIAPDPIRSDPLEREPAPALTESQLRAQAAWQALLGVLYPDGGESDDAVTFDELDAGRAALGELIARAEEADLLEHDALDDALAELFARTWPRAAPFVEQVNDAFHWLGEAGALEERPALMFLNQRLKGMRFHEKVQRPDHPLNKAWVELSRRGRATMFDRLRVKRLEVHKLLTGIRERYPELETYLDPERVASWEGNAGTEAGPPKSVFLRIALMGVLFFALVRILSHVFSPMPPLPNAPYAQTGPSVEEVDALVADVFGEGTNMAAVRAADPVFADQLEPLIGVPQEPGEAMLAFIRLKALASGRVADEASLVVRADLRSVWMRAAQRQSDAVCRKLMNGRFVGLGLALTDKERGRERALLRQLLDAGLLGKEVAGGAYRYDIPGWLVDDMIKRSGLSQDALVKALTDPDDPERCAAEAALVEAARGSQRPVPLEVLKGL